MVTKLNLKNLKSDDIDWDDLPDYLFVGARSGVPEKLKHYLLQLKSSGKGRVACSMDACLSYQTIQSQRMREPDFEQFEFLAEQCGIAEVDSALYTSATNPDNKHQVGAASLWKKFRYNWVEPKTVIEHIQNSTINFDDWDEKKLTVKKPKCDKDIAILFVELMEKYNNDDSDN